MSHLEVQGGRTIRHLSWEELHLDPECEQVVKVWLKRGDGIAVYENQDLGHPQLGHRRFASYGSPAAQFETDIPPDRLPDFPGEINWRYCLVGVHRPDQECSILPDGSETKLIKLDCCPHKILSAMHYRQNGTCRCDDPTHRIMLDWGYQWDHDEERWV